MEQRNVLKNVCYPMEIAGMDKKEMLIRADELLEMVGLSDRKKSYPSQLSGGQKQRVAIARALATRPKYLLCDEATSALDPNTTRAILELLKEINRTLGVTIVVITHEMSVIDKICDRVAVIHESRIAETGRVSRVFASPQSEIAKELILPKGSKSSAMPGSRCIRIIFDGSESNMPVISELILATKVHVNIMYADTKNIEGKAYGHMILSLPDEESDREKIFAWLEANNIEYREEV